VGIEKCTPRRSVRTTVISEKLLRIRLFFHIVVINGILTIPPDVRYKIACSFRLYLYAMIVQYANSRIDIVIILRHVFSGNFRKRATLPTDDFQHISNRSNRGSHSIYRVGLLSVDREVNSRHRSTISNILWISLRIRTRKSDLQLARPHYFELDRVNNM